MSLCAQALLNSIYNNQITSARKITRGIGFCKILVHTILTQQLHLLLLLHHSRIKFATRSFLRRTRFCPLIFEKYVQEPLFVDSILFTN